MKTIRRAASELSSKGARWLLALILLCALPIYAQAPSAPAKVPPGAAAKPALAKPTAAKPAPAATAKPVPAPTPAPPASQPPQLRAVLALDGPWRFATGDDPRWADPAFDDSSWPTVDLNREVPDQDVDSYSGYAWYRLRLDPQQLADMTRLSGSAPLELMITGNSTGQLEAYVNGVQAGSTQGMGDPVAVYQSPPFEATLAGIDLSKAVVIAIRAWAPPQVKLQRGVLAKVELGRNVDIAERISKATAQQRDEHAVASMLESFLFLGVALLGLALYLAQRHHAEYLWLGILCLTVAIRGLFDVLYGLSRISLAVYDPFNQIAGRVFMAVTLEFVLLFTARPASKPVRAFQISVLVLPLIYFIHLQQVYDILSVSAEIVFCAIVCVLLFRAWRAGRGDAGVMLIPFLLAATADSAGAVLDYGAASHWLPEALAAHRYHLGPIGFNVGTIAYFVFLLSLIAVILYRFVLVSQEEQKSNAEIAAARSVQAMLIPTKLPSNRYFMLESAYIPVNGVGGDFFQVLPLEDGSLKIVVGDVSGKGLQAAMNASTLVGAFRNELSHDPATVLNHLNNVMLGLDAPTRGKDPESVVSFATCCCARIFRDGTMEIANAGHLSPYRDGREMELPPGLPLGVIQGMTYEKVTIQLDAGVRLIFLSDGVVEAANPQGELFGFERTQQVSNEPARYIAQTAKRFGQTDDITVVSLYIASCDARTARRELVEAH